MLRMEVVKWWLGWGIILKPTKSCEQSLTNTNHLHPHPGFSISSESKYNDLLCPQWLLKQDLCCETILFMSNCNLGTGCGAVGSSPAVTIDMSGGSYSVTPSVLISPKWHPIVYTVHFLWPGWKWLKSSVLTRIWRIGCHFGSIYEVRWEKRWIGIGSGMLCWKWSQPSPHTVHSDLAA